MSREKGWQGKQKGLLWSTIFVASLFGFLFFQEIDDLQVIDVAMRAFRGELGVTSSDGSMRAPELLQDADLTKEQVLGDEPIENVSTGNVPTGNVPTGNDPTGNDPAREAAFEHTSGEAFTEIEKKIAVETARGLLMTGFLPLDQVYGYVRQINKILQERAEQPPIEPEMLVYLSFDDGPTAFTEKILDTLKEYNACATFFFLEPRIRDRSSTVIRARDEGHALGSHGVTHKYSKFYASTESILWEMDETIRALKEEAGVDSVLVRVPYGTYPNLSDAQIKIMRGHGYKIWDWNVDSEDWRTQDQHFVTNTIRQLKWLRVKKIAPVILMHEREETAEYLPQLLTYLVNEGYVFRVIDSSLPEVLTNGR